MEQIMEIAKANNLYVIEDNAQAIGCDYTFSNGFTKKTKANPNRVKAGSTKAKLDKRTPNKRPGIFARLSRITRL